MLSVDEAGNRSHPTIVFLHGGGGSGWMWRLQVEALQNDYHLLVPDLPEHGRSAAIKPFTIANSATRIAELIRARAHGGMAHVVGLSEGGQIALALLSMAPEVVDRAIISSALVREMYALNRFGEGFWTALYRSIEGLNKYEWWMRLNMLSYGIPDQFLPEMRATYRTLTADAFAHLLLENQRFRLPEGLERVASAVLAVGGEKEYRIIHDSIKDIAAAIPGAKGYLVHHSPRMSLSRQHNWNMNAPELFNRTVRAWLESQPLPSALKEVA